MSAPASLRSAPRFCLCAVMHINSPALFVATQTAGKQVHLDRTTVVMHVPMTTDRYMHLWMGSEHARCLAVEPMLPTIREGHCFGSSAAAGQGTLSTFCATNILSCEIGA